MAPCGNIRGILCGWTRGLWSSHSRCLVSTQNMLGLPKRGKGIILGTNGVAMARHGLILSQDEATSLGNVFKHLPGLRDIVLRSKIAAESPKSQNTVFDRIFLYRSEGLPERDISSLCVMGWGLEVAGNSSAVPPPPQRSVSGRKKNVDLANILGMALQSCGRPIMEYL